MFGQTNKFYNFTPKRIPIKFAGAKIIDISTLYGDMGFVHIKTSRGTLTISFSIREPETCNL
jgi:hypothetical protein